MALRSLSKNTPSSKPNFVSLEGFVDAMVIEEGLIRGIESVRHFDIGVGTELKQDYSAKDHKRFDHLIPTVDSRWPERYRSRIGCSLYRLEARKNGNVSGSRILLDRRRGRKSGPAGRTPRV